jgi:hypothetical protein
MAQDFPTQAQVVIIGGGIIGCSVAYHLSKLGWRDVVLLEQGQLSGGTTWHAAGLVGQLRSHANMTSLIKYSTQLYSELEAETGLATGWKNCGSLSRWRAPSDRMTVLKRTAASARAQGVDMRGDLAEGGAGPLAGHGASTTSWAPSGCRATARPIRPTSRRRWPRARATAVSVSSRRCGSPRPTPGRARAARGSPAWRRPRAPSRPRSSSTAPASGRARSAACAASRCRSIRPSTCISSPRRWRACIRDLPVMRDPDGYIYFKEEVGGLVMGGFEPEAKPWGMAGIPTISSSPCCRTIGTSSRS